MSVSVIAGSAVGAASSTSIDKPTGYTDTANDVILVQCQSSQVTTPGIPTLPTGFTSIANKSSNTLNTIWGWKLDSGAGETWPKTWTQGTGSAFNVWNCIILRGNDTTTPVDASATASSNTTSLAIAAITATVAGDALVIMLSDANDIDVSTWPSGVTEYAAASNPTGNGVMTGTKTGLASGSTGALTVTLNTGPGDNSGCGILVKASSAGSVKSTGTVAVGADVGGLVGSFGANRLMPVSAIGADVGGLIGSKIGAVRLSGTIPIGGETGGLIATVVNYVPITAVLGAFTGGLLLAAGAIRRPNPVIGGFNAGLIAAAGAKRLLPPNTIGGLFSGLVATAQRNTNGVIQVTQIGGLTGGLIAAASGLKQRSAQIGGLTGGLTATANNGKVIYPYWLRGPKTLTEINTGDIF